MARAQHRVCLIRPGSRDRRFVRETPWALQLARPLFNAVSSVKLGAGNDTPPLGLMTLAALTPDDWDVVICDEEVEDLDYDLDADVVGITLMTITARRAYEIADEFRARGVPVVLGGIHATALPSEAAQHADALVLGEAEDVWPTVLEDVRHGRLRASYRSVEHADLTKAVIPRRDVLSTRSYLTTNLVQTTRGCPNDCAFCSIRIIVGARVRCKPVEHVIAEIERFDDSLVVFVDDNIVARPSYAKELFKALIPLNLQWWGQGSLAIAEDPELLELAARSGCRVLLIGLESLSPDNIAAVNKTRTNRVESYAKAIQSLHEHGISVEGSFILGLDSDDDTVFSRTADFIQESAVDMPLPNVLIPHPATRIRGDLEAQGRIIHSDWDEYGKVFGRIAYEPLKMTAEELRAGQIWIHERVFGLRAAATRVVRSRTNVVPNAAVGVWQWRDVRDRLAAAGASGGGGTS